MHPLFVLLIIILCLSPLLLFIHNTTRESDKVEKILVEIDEERPFTTPLWPRKAMKCILLREYGEEEWTALHPYAIKNFEPEEGYSYRLLLIKTTLLRPETGVYPIQYDLLEILEQKRIKPKTTKQ